MVLKMAEVPITVNSEQREMLMTFLDQTGYGPSDILSLSYLMRKFLTRNGGVYKLTAKGKVIHIDGPSPDPTRRV